MYSLFWTCISDGEKTTVFDLFLHFHSGFGQFVVGRDFLVRCEVLYVRYRDIITLSYIELLVYIFFLLALKPPSGVYFTALYRALASSLTRFHDHIQRRATVGRTPLNEWSVRRRDLYLTTHNTHNTQTSKPWVGFEPTIAAGERP